MLTRRQFGGSLAAALVWRLGPTSAESGPRRVYAYVTCGDNQNSPESLPVDSPATVEAIFEFLSKTFRMKRVYWRGEQDRMWLQHYNFRPENPRYYDYFVNWLGYLDKEVKVQDIAIASAHRNGMEIYVLDGLFEHGAQGMTGGNEMFPYCGEDRLRIEQPEWFPVDRWGERVSTGPIEFCYPEARQALISRYVLHVTKYGYDGIAFYTYVENLGARYRDEYGFNEPIVTEFKRRHGVDIRNDPFDKQAWYRLRGEYLTQFIHELHSALAAKGKKLSMAIYPPTPNYPGPWDGGKVDVPPGGMVYIDWEGWVEKGIVDELFVWWRGDQKAALNRMLKACKGRPVELTVAAARPFDNEWKPFVEAGVTPVSVWAPGFEVDRVSPQPSTVEALKNPDWRWRMQALADIRIGAGLTFFGEREAAGEPKADPSVVAALAHDPHVLVRGQAIFTLGALQADAYVHLLEAALTDKESSVRIAAAYALGRVNGPETPRRIVAALLKDDQFLMKQTCVGALAAMKEKAQPVLLEGIKSFSPAVREVCVRALSENGLPSSVAALLSVIESEESEPIVGYAITGVNTGGNSPTSKGLVKHASPEVIRAFMKALSDPRSAVQMWAAMALQQVVSALSADQARDALSMLQQLFREFGDGCVRSDAAWGWRVVGNTMLGFGRPGREMLEAMLTERRGAHRIQDRWLAWAAYQVLYVPQSPVKAILCEENEAVETHARYAPPFPGWRT